MASLESASRFGRNTLVLQATAGQRKYDSGADFDGSALSGSFYRDWSEVLSTRTAVVLGSDDPVFVRRHESNGSRIQRLPCGFARTCKQLPIATHARSCSAFRFEGKNDRAIQCLQSPCLGITYCELSCL